ncbi:hypothetical protein D9M68_687400 [compost metagenome]
MGVNILEILGYQFFQPVIEPGWRPLHRSAESVHVVSQRLTLANEEVNAVRDRWVDHLPKTHQFLFQSPG